MNNKVDYETIEAELQRLIDELYGAEPARIQAESNRLRRLAERIEDEIGRQRAIRRAEQLPKLVAGPAGGSSVQFRQAEQLFGQAINLQTPPAERIAELERTMRTIGDLAQQAPARESGAILRMNSPLVRLVEHLRQGGQ